MVVINSPHNPTGKVTTQAMLDALADAMEGTDAWLVSDEVYGPMVHDSRPAPLPSLHPGLRNKTLGGRELWEAVSRHRLENRLDRGACKRDHRIEKIHQYDVFSTGAPFQAGLALTSKPKTPSTIWTPSAPFTLPNETGFCTG